MQDKWMNSFKISPNSFMGNAATGSNFTQVQPDKSLNKKPATFDTVHFNAPGTLSAEGAMRMDANYSPASAWAGQYSNPGMSSPGLYGDLLSTLQGVSHFGAQIASLDASLGAASMQYTLPNAGGFPRSYAANYTAGAQKLDESEDDDSGQEMDYGGPKIDPSDPSGNSLTIDNEALDNLTDSEYTLGSGKTLTLKNLTKSGLESIDAESGNNTIKIKGDIGKDDDAKLAISADSSSKIEFSTDDWKIDPGSRRTSNKITFINGRGQKVEVCGSEVAITICKTDIKTMLYEGMRTSELTALLKGKSLGDIEHLIQDNSEVFSCLPEAQQKMIGKAYAVAYAKEHVTEKYPEAENLDTLTFDELSETYPDTLSAAKEAACEIDDNLPAALEPGMKSSTAAEDSTSGDGVVTDGAPADDCTTSDAEATTHECKTSCTDAASTGTVSSSDELIEQLKGDRRIPITKDNFDKVDFEKIMALPPQEAAYVISNIDLVGINVPQDKKLPVALKDRLAVQFAIYANVQLAKAAGVPEQNEGSGNLGYTLNRETDFKKLIEVAKGCGQGELARILDVMSKNVVGLKKVVKSNDLNMTNLDKGVLRTLNEIMENNPERDLGSLLKNPNT